MLDEIIIHLFIMQYMPHSSDRDDEFLDQTFRTKYFDRYFNVRVNKTLRYYATFKVRKSIHFCKKLLLALDCRQSSYSP